MLVWAVTRPSRICNRWDALDLSYVNGIDLNSTGLTQSTGMVISHFYGGLKSTEATI